MCVCVVVHFVFRYLLCVCRCFCVCVDVSQISVCHLQEITHTHTHSTNAHLVLTCFCLHPLTHTHTLTQCFHDNCSVIAVTRLFHGRRINHYMECFPGDSCLVTGRIGGGVMGQTRSQRTLACYRLNYTRHAQKHSDSIKRYSTAENRCT